MIEMMLASLPQEIQARDYREEKLGQFNPIAVLTVNPGLRGGGEVFSIYAPFTGPRSASTRYLAIRRISTDHNSPATEQWVVASNCPGAEAVLLEMEALQPPSIDVPTIGRDDGQGPPLDGIGYGLFVRYPTWSNGFAYQMEFSTNVGTPLAAWAVRFHATLEPCWTQSRPAAWGDLPGAARN